MARYDYRCTSCGRVFEVEHPMNEHPDIACPNCGAAAERIFTTSGIVFEGHGFYNTDQRDSGKKTAGASSSEKKAAQPATTKTDTATHKE